MEIYDVVEDLVKALVKLKRIEICSKEFNDIHDNHAKIEYVEDLLTKFQTIPKLELKVNSRTAKNDEKSAQLRKEGNNFFSLKNKNYFKALHLYNESICFAENGSDNLSIGYANRSAILFEWKRYKECLENIRLAKAAQYPGRLLHKLEKREKDCIEKIDTQPTEEKHNFNLSYDRHERVPFIANCLDMRYTEDLGRHIYTKRNLYPGDLVSIEDAFCTVLLPHMKYIRCANCKRENYLTLIPCSNCTSAMFCSTKCLEEGSKAYHQFECPIIDFLFVLFNKIHLTALRVCLVALSLFKTPEECLNFCNEPANKNQSSFTLDYNKFTKQEHYKAIHGLVTNQSQRSTADLFQRAIIAAVLKSYLLAHTPLSELLTEIEHRNFFFGLLFRHLQTSPSNMHSVDLIEQKNENRDDQNFAAGGYAFGSLLNHSCAPNTVRIYNGTTTYLFIIRSIPENGMLYDNYGYHYATQPKNIRQKKLETQYHFICKCEACENDYPLYDNLPVPKDVPEAINAIDVHSLIAYNKQFALENYQRYCEFLKKNSKFYPCSQISATEESLKMALNIIVDSVPLKAKY